MNKPSLEMNRNWKHKKLNKEIKIYVKYETILARVLAPSLL